MKKKLISVIAILIIMLMMAGCTEDNSTTITQESTEDSEPITYEAMLYDNQGNDFLNFYGNNFTITPNKIKQYGWNTDGTWTSFYETSSVVTIEIDGSYIQSCGSTVIFKDTRLDMLDIPDELNSVEAGSEDGYTVSVDGQGINTYVGLTNWWYDIKEQGQHGSKVVLIQSQDGYNIGAFIGDDVTWEVADKLPKTTKIMIDGLPLYIHRSNFTIIDSELIEDSVN
ncbi:DUF5052 family protein [Roseburia sp. 831b]|uniref:DUF5052 family protein n=1 Tax=Roseburia sp. 831b TaxID=1261635 RepID=UPI000952F892|nr:DUF5052 family protein [Roseburia sp. 831b]WVK74240.1 DUF5052 family protein [Roseburia sp. 831b]